MWLATPAVNNSFQYKQITGKPTKSYHREEEAPQTTMDH